MPLGLQPTADGSHTLYHPEIKEHYHSVHGAIGESMHVFIQNGLHAHHSSRLDILEMGFGTGLNALLTALYARQEIHYTGLDIEPPEPELYKALNYPDILGKNAGKIWNHLHEIPWGEEHQLTDSFTLCKIRADLLEFPLQEDRYNLVYYDAFSPKVQPRLWNEETIKRIVKSIRQKGIFVTYSAMAALRGNLEAAGMYVELLEGPKGKRHMTRGKKF